MNILITGAFGFLGTNLSKALSTAFKHHLIAVDVSEPEHHHYSEFVSWDKLHTLSKKKIDAIIHLAGNTEIKIKGNDEHFQCKISLPAAGRQ